MRSDNIKKGINRLPHRSLLKALGLTDEEIDRPIIGIVNSANTIIPGHMHLNEIVDAVKNRNFNVWRNTTGIFNYWHL